MLLDQMFCRLMSTNHFLNIFLPRTQTHEPRENEEVENRNREANKISNQWEERGEREREWAVQREIYIYNESVFRNNNYNCYQSSYEETRAERTRTGKMNYRVVNIIR